MADAEVILGIKGDTSGFEKSAKDIEQISQTNADKVTEIYKKAFAAVGLAVAAAVGVGMKYNAEMESYTTSFEVMMGSYEDALSLVDEMKQKAAATPFELTDIAKATQMLMSFGFSAEEAMTTFEMLGDISQGNAEKLNSVTRAYAKMHSSQKVTLEDINMMIDAGFNPLQEIAEHTGESMQSLYDRISKGTMSVDEITASMQRSTSAGGKYFQSMEKQSKTFQGRMSTLGDTAQEAFGKITAGLSEWATNKALPAAIDAVEWLGNNFEQLVPILAAATSGATALVVALNFDKAKKDVLELIGAFKANPYALWIGAATALIAALLSVTSALQKQHEEMSGYNKIIQETSDNIDNIAESQKKYEATFSDTNNAIAATYKSAKGWLDRLKELEAKTELTAEEQKEWNALLLKVKNTIPGVTDLIDEQTGAIKGGTSALDGYINAWEQTAKIEAYNRIIQETTDSLIDAEAQYEIAAQTYAELTESIGGEEQLALIQQAGEQFGIYGESAAEVAARLYEAAQAGDANSAAMQLLYTQIVSSTEAYGDLYGEIVRTQENMANAQTQIDEYNTKIDENINKALELQEAQAATADGYNAEGEAALGAANATEEATKIYEEALNRRTAVTQEAFKAIESTINLTAEEMINNLTQNQELVWEWTQNIATLAERGLDEGLLLILEEAGPEAAATVANLVNASDEELAELNKVFRNGGEDAVRMFMDTLERPDVQTSGSAVVDEAASGVAGNYSLINAATRTVTDTKAAMYAQVINSNFNTIGEQILAGVEQGLYNRRGSLLATARSIANEIKATMQSALDIHSPSGVGEWIGEMWDFGIAKGMRNKISEIKKTSHSVAQAVAATTSAPIASTTNNSTTMTSSSIVIAKIADCITVREEADIDRISEVLTRRIRTEERIRGLA